MENEKMNYEKEFEKLNVEKTATFKASVGSTILTILDEPTQTVFKDKNTGKETPQIKLTIKVSGSDHEQVWYIGKGISLKSLYGQLIALGKGEGCLAGKQIQLLVKPSKNKDGGETKDYTVVEAMKYLQQNKEEVI